MLMRMYDVEKNGYKVKELNYQAGDVAGENGYLRTRR
jgi:hypothetical protein